MSKVLTYHKSQNGGHWFKSVAYGKNEIEAIKDPQGGDTDQAPTSIPSPFARFDLVRTAFSNLSLNTSLKGTRNDEKLVSEAFDLGEILFNYEDFKDCLKLVAWSQNDLNTLLNSSSQSHQRLGKALELYLNQDADSYNFKHIQRLFVVFFKGIAIGGTSPSTIFFSSANTSHHLNIPLGNQHLFDGNPCPLHKRDIEYQKMWYCLRKMPDFQKRFKEITDYLETSEKLLKLEDPSLYNKHIRSENGDDLLKEDYYTTKFDELTAGGNNDIVEIIGFPLRKKRIVLNDIANVSGFVIKTNRYKSLFPDSTKFPIPLALQKDFHKTIQYTQGNWNPNTEVLPYYDEDWRKNLRRLPGQSTNYPWLTISDFLEPYLVRVNYPINIDAYLTGSLMGMPENKGYLLPLKKDFFDFFGFEDLEKGNVKLTMQGKDGGGVKVSLQIPIESRNGQQEYISFDRTYIPANANDLPKPNLSYNEGFIIEEKFTINIYPLVRSGEYKLNANYRIQLIEQKTNNEDIKIDFMDLANNSPIEIESEKYRSPRNGELKVISKYFVLKKEFDYLSIQFKNPKENINAVLVPKWFRYNGRGKQYSFAIDFGTSNTHVEFKTPDKASQRFSIDKQQIGTLVSPAYYNEAKIADILLYLPLRFEFLPLYIDNNTTEGFPLRTAIVYSANIDVNRPTYTLADFNIPFYYEQETSRALSSDETSVNLKWAKDDEATKKKITSFLEELLMMIRNKVVFEGGDLNETKIYWFYPSSMQKGRIRNLKMIWDELFSLHITDIQENKPLPVSESIAPFYHYKEERPNLLASDKPALSIDIGGGTTDVVVYERNSPVLLTSFRFAGNAIYGDGFRERASVSNGFVIKYADRISALLEGNGLEKLVECQKVAISGKKSEEIISLWFAIEKNKSVKNQKDLSFNRMLAADDDLKIVFVFFYSAIIYHIAKLLKSKKFEMPKSITFSGTGSKLMDIVTKDDEQLTAFTKVIIEKVFGQTYDNRERLEVFCDRSKPKEATCKGALVMENSDLAINPQEITEVYTATYEDQYDSLNYEDIKNRDIKESILKEVENFIDFFFSLNKSFNFENELCVSPNYTHLAKETLKNNLSSYLSEGVALKTKAMTEEDKALEETLFFYPLIGAINNLAYQIGRKV
jgi:hypothetical protein